MFGNVNFTLPKNSEAASWIALPLVAVAAYGLSKVVSSYVKDGKLDMPSQRDIVRLGGEMTKVGLGTAAVVGTVALARNVPSDVVKDALRTGTYAGAGVAATKIWATWA